MSGKSAEKHDDEVCAISLDQAHELVKHLEAGNQTEVDRIVGEMSNLKENCLYQEIGKLTRELHEKLNSFIDDTRIRSIMHDDIPDARERLSYVMKVTEESAHSTITAVEHGMPIVSELGDKATEIKDQWRDFMSHRKGVDVFREMTTDLDDYLQQVVDETNSIYKDLNEVLMAQSYQDITGQVIQRVINLVQTLEQSLVGIIQTTSQGMDVETKKPADTDSSGHGPVVPGVTGGEVMNSQDDVDDLLSTLGF